MPQSFRTPYSGYVAVMKKSGTASVLATGSQINIPTVHTVPLNPDNNSFPGVIATSSYPSERVKGMKTPTVSITACYKPSWCTANLFNSLINIGTNNATDVFSIAFKDDNSGSLRIWDDAKCERLQFQQNAMGGPLMVTMDFKARFGDSEAPYGATDAATGSAYGSAPAFATPGSVDSGELYGMADTVLTGLTTVRAYTLTLMRGQAFLPYFNGTRYASQIATTMFSGGMSVDQDPGGTLISNTGTAVIAIGPAATAGSIVLTAAVVRDDNTYPFDISIGNLSSRYSLVSLSTGGNPASIVAG